MVLQHVGVLQHLSDGTVCLVLGAVSNDGGRDGSDLGRREAPDPLEDDLGSSGASTGVLGRISGLEGADVVEHPCNGTDLNIHSAPVRDHCAQCRDSIEVDETETHVVLVLSREEDRVHDSPDVSESLHGSPPSRYLQHGRVDAHYTPFKRIIRYRWLSFYDCHTRLESLYKPSM